MRNCKDISKLVSESLDHDLTWFQRLSLRLHALLCNCPICKKFYSQMRLTRDAARELGRRMEDGETGGEARLSDEARQRIRASLASLDPSS
jgi:hypothetical protein